MNSCDINNDSKKTNDSKKSNNAQYNSLITTTWYNNFKTKKDKRC